MYFLCFVQAAGDYYSESYYGLESSQESLNSLSHCRLFTPPATKPKNNIFFNSDDTLYKKETRKFTIPRIEVESDEPVFNLQVTDFSEPSPKNIILSYDETGTSFETKQIENVESNINHKSWKEKANNFVQQKSFSIDIHENPDIDIGQVCDTDKFLSISAKKIRQQRLYSSSMQDLSSSTSSINSGVHESNLDLSHIDADDPIKHKNWKSPDEVRHGQVDSKNFEKAISFPDLHRCEFYGSNSKSVSEEKLSTRNKLTEYERLEVLKLLHDWSLNGSDSKSDFTLKLSKSSEHLEKENVERSEKSILKSRVKFSSEPNLSPKINKEMIIIGRYSSDNDLKNEQKSVEDDLMHKCEFRNCIFNKDTFDYKPKSILKVTNEECLKKTPNLGTKSFRRYSEIIEPKSFNSQLVRCDSLERLTLIKNDKSNLNKKFPESYIVTKRKNNQKSNNKSPKKSPKVIVLKKKYLPKTWKSCSDIKHRKTVRKCCRLAKKNCPIMKNSMDIITSRKTQSCIDIERDYPARLAALKDYQVGVVDCKTIYVGHEFSFFSSLDSNHFYLFYLVMQFFNVFLFAVYWN